MVQASISTQKDFFCIEITPHFSNDGSGYFSYHDDTFLNLFAFDIGITTKPRVKPNSLIATSPEFREFLENHKLGHEIKLRITNGKNQRVTIGTVTGVTNGSIIKYASFHPFGQALSKQFPLFDPTEELTFKEVFKGKGISSLIEANILKYLKNKYPKAELHYSDSVITSPRRKQLEKIRHKDPYEPGFVEDEYNIFKRFLKKQRNRKLAKK